MGGRHQPEMGADSPSALANVTPATGRKIRGVPWRQVAGMRIHDTTIIEVAEGLRSGNLICLTVTEHSSRQPYATGILQDNGGWINGRYFDNIGDAFTDYLERI